jgi:ferredoxin
MKVVHFKKDCISCGACAAISPEYWEMDEVGLAQLKEGTSINEHWEKDIDLNVAPQEKNFHQEAADVCPVNIIHLKDDGFKQD